jgi:uncharacterized protein (TIGR00730 family)
MTIEKAVCVFCGSGSGNNPVYTEHAQQLGKLFIERNWGLVYGGGTRGIMGALAKSIASSGGSVEGIIPRALIKREQDNPEESVYGNTTVVGDMHTRKRMMGQRADAFVALAGGYGTAEELFEVITWNQLGIHSRPIVLLNTNGFYNGLIAWIDQAVKEGFISQGNRNIVIAVDSPEKCIDAIVSYEVPEGRFDLDWSDETPN